MACINPDGTISASARAALEAAELPITPSDLVKRTGFPLFKVRRIARELMEAGLLSETDQRYQITEAGADKLAHPE